MMEQDLLETEGSEEASAHVAEAKAVALEPEVDFGVVSLGTIVLGLCIPILKNLFRPRNRNSKNS